MDSIIEDWERAGSVTVEGKTDLLTCESLIGK
jgi:hypothetical protein